MKTEVQSITLSHVTVESALKFAFSLTKDQPSLPMDPIYLAKRLGLSLVHSELNAGVCFANYYRSKTDEPSKIEYSYCLDLPQRFAITRAIGHHLLGHPSTSFFIRGTNAGNQDNNAKEASRFAMMFLIPEEQVCKRMKSINSEEELSASFQVPVKIMLQRIALLPHPLFEPGLKL